MAKRAGLNALKVKTVTRVGLHADGGGLYLQVSAGGTRSWIYRYQLAGRRRLMGLGPLGPVTLAEARDKALDARRLVIGGKDPIDARRIERGAARVAKAKAETFQQCADAYVEAHRAGWRSTNHADQWRSSLANDVFPIIGDLPVAAIDTPIVLSVLKPIWQQKPESASRIRGRIEAILSYSVVAEHRPPGDNPARWRGHLENLLPAKRKIAPVQHHAALAYNEISSFMAELQARPGVSARALEFTILTAARSGEALGARWDEFNLAERLWIIAAERMKARKEHRAPLSDAAVGIVEAMAASRNGDLVFTGRVANKPMNRVALEQVIRRMGRSDTTVHGFRSTFRDWVAERTSYPGEMAEMALAHAVNNAVEAAYRRGDMLDRRRRLMQDWADFCSAPVATDATKVVTLRG